MILLFVVGALLVAGGAGVAMTKYPHVDRRFKTGYKNNELPEDGDLRGLWAVLAGLILLVAPCVSAWRFLSAPEPIAAAVAAPVDMGVAIDMAAPRHRKRRPKRHAEPEYEMMSDVEGTAAPPVKQNQDVDDE